MKFQDHAMNTAFQLCVFKAIAQMMRDRIRELQIAEDEYDRKWAMDRLAMLVEQYDEAHERYTAEEAVA